MNLPIPCDEIHLFLVDMAELRPHLNLLESFLSVEEVARSQRYFSETDRVRSVASRGVLRILLSAYTGRRAKQLAFAQTPAGKPLLARAQPDARAIPENEDWQFSVSHSADHLLLGISVGRSVGVDIEQIRPIGVHQLGPRCFHRDEIAWLEKQPDVLSAFYSLWSCKEAVVKAIGLGLQFALPSFAVKCSPVFEHAQFDLPMPQPWTVCELSVLEKYRAATACALPPGTAPPRVRWFSTEILLAWLRNAG